MDFREGGTFAVGLTAGVGLVLIVFVFAGLSFDTLFSSWLKDFILTLIGFLGGVLVSYYFYRVSERFRKEDIERSTALREEDLKRELEKVRNEQAVTFVNSQQDLYDALYFQIKTLDRVALRNTPSIFQIGLEQYASEFPSDVIHAINFEEEEWLQIRSIKTYFKKLRDQLPNQTLTDKQIRDLFNRGASGFFYNLWALTVAKYYLVREPQHKRKELGMEAFAIEISVFRDLEPYLNEDGKALKSGWVKGVFPH